jgi:membrane fusion protein, heavy metal efflux system
MRATMLWMWCALCTIGGASAQAHGGDDHDHGHDEPAKHTQAPDQANHMHAAVSTATEVVLRWNVTDARTEFVGWLSRAATNEPVEGAEVMLSLSTTPPVNVTMTATAPGTYVGSATPPVGASPARLTVVVGDVVDVFAIESMHINESHEHHDEHEHHDDGHDHDDHNDKAPAWWPFLLVAGVVAVVVTWVVRRRKASKLGAGPAGAVLMTMMIASLTHAHGDDDHGHDDHASEPANKAPTTAAGMVQMQKVTQFLLGVRTAPATRKTLTPRVEAPGVVRVPPERHAAIVLPHTGQVLPPAGGFPALGSSVKRGQTLAILDASLSAIDRASLRTEQARADTDIEAARARAEAAQKRVARLRAMSAVVSMQELEAAEVEAAQASAAATEAQARRATYASAGAARFVLTAPLAGVVADVDVAAGEIKDQGTRIFLVLDPAQLQVEAKIPEQALGVLGATTTAIVRVDAYPDVDFPAKLVAQGQVIDEASRTAKIVFQVDNRDQRLKLGMFARVSLGVGAGVDVLSVPRQAVLRQQGRSFVFVHDAPESFVMREVVLGMEDTDGVEIRSGVAAGERVVTVGIASLRQAVR